MVTVRVSTIDPAQATGGDVYQTIAEWEADTDNDLVTQDRIEIGELVNATHSTSGSTITFSGATTDATHYRVLRAATGARYDPASDTGAKITHTGSAYVIQVLEEGFRMEGFGAEWTTAAPTASNSAVLWFTDSTNANSTPAVADGVTLISGLTGANGVNKCFWSHPSCDYPVVWRNCVAVSDAGGNMQAGFRGTFQAGSVVANCVAKGGFVDGFNTEADTAVEISNCVAYGASDKDFDLAGTTNTVIRNCASSDATAVGVGALTSIGAAHKVFHGAPVNDFRPLVEGPLHGAGRNLSSSGFTTDIKGESYGAKWNIGAYANSVRQGSRVDDVRVETITFTNDDDHAFISTRGYDSVRFIPVGPTGTEPTGGNITSFRVYGSNRQGGTLVPANEAVIPEQANYHKRATVTATARNEGYLKHPPKNIIVEMSTDGDPAAAGLVLRVELRKERWHATMVGGN